mmetsp:Transcript_37091/g.82502  ORF Transcript_37091/g.82502 Transcript_37091/m.82502 type:complete len:676 (-) Transcript_37091:1157-3184(-)|eukprot:CAMPEP_0202893736 /NCGR_PEP_ID=MMETSP1392-20130828/3258_1 /ASSEMBLY_ACC=CAM_ASM_000868 /TAXON_ID=225041 /ORGANISM="Chlamydomonas chlamydogama, Strain SAG 11-48b" /LENGTH=675 /DNA_ID=CAMNT_0049578177 /DNA_START=262 /DNA_END=2289 /DNA_ORIENTATION=+
MADDVAMPEYMWLVVVGSFAAFAYGWGTGSNDVANAFGTSVGAKTLTMAQATIIAVIFEFTGAIVLGRVSTSVIAGGIANIDAFYTVPEVYAYGMVCALTVGFVWQALASYWEMNVSATHSIIGAIIGFSLVWAGPDAVNWATEDPASFPPFKGVVPIVLAWFVSPILTGLASAIIFGTLRFLVLRRQNAYALSFWVLPFFVVLTSWINIYFVFTKGAKKSFSENGGDDWSDDKAAWIAACCAAGLGFLTIVVVLPILRWRAKTQLEAQEASADAAAAAENGGQVKIEKEGAEAKAIGTDAESDDLPEDATFKQKSLRSMKSLSRVLTRGLTYDIHEIIEEDPIIAAMHEGAERFEPRVEFAFSYLQVFSAICVIFAHGAGEVGYMAGPLTTIWRVVETGTLPSKVNAPIWCILVGAFGLVIGLATYGYKVTRAMGVRMAKLSPTRGFAAELSTALVIMIAAQYGLPTSSSQCITGGILGVGILENVKTGVNWRFFAKTLGMWILTLGVAIGFTAALFAQGLYAPGIVSLNDLNQYEEGLATSARGIYSDFNSTLYQYQAAANASRIPNLDYAAWRKLNSTITAQMTDGKNMITYKNNGTVNPEVLLDYVFKAFNLVQQYSVITLGQQTVAPGASACTGPNFNPANPMYNVSCRAWNMFRSVPAPYNTTAFFPKP